MHGTYIVDWGLQMRPETYDLFNSLMYIVAEAWCWPKLYVGVR